MASFLIGQPVSTGDATLENTHKRERSFTCDEKRYAKEARPRTVQYHTPSSNRQQTEYRMRKCLYMLRVVQAVVYRQCCLPCPLPPPPRAWSSYPPPPSRAPLRSSLDRFHGRMNRCRQGNKSTCPLHQSNQIAASNLPT